MTTTSLHEEVKAEIRTMHDEVAIELSQLHTAHSEAEAKNGEMGEALDGVLGRLTKLEDVQKQTLKEHRKLMDKYMDLENRSGFQNIRIVGVKEGVEGDNMFKFLENFFPAVLGAEHFSTPLMIDQAHRSLAQRPGSDSQRSRTILVCLHYYKDKLKILDTNKAKGTLMFQGLPVHIFPDMSPEVSHLKAAYTPLKKKLRGAGISYSLLVLLD